MSGLFGMIKLIIENKLYGVEFYSADLVNLTGLNKASVNRVLSRLVKMGFLERITIKGTNIVYVVCLDKQSYLFQLYEDVLKNDKKLE